MSSLLFFDIVKTEFFLRFQATHLDLIIGQMSFESLKSFFVKYVKDRNTCCCIYHVKFNELRLALNLMRTKNIIHDIERWGCHCDHVCSQHGQPCQASSIVYKGIIHLWEDVVCPKGELDSECRNPTLAKCRGEAQHSQSWGFGVLWDS
jgi:hypothetical protein